MVSTVGSRFTVDWELNVPANSHLSLRIIEDSSLSSLFSQSTASFSQGTYEDAHTVFEPEQNLTLNHNDIVPIFIRTRMKKCVFWNPSTGKWSDQGCSLVEIPTLDGSERLSHACACSHLTDFAGVAYDAFIVTNLTISELNEVFYEDHFSISNGASLTFLILSCFSFFLIFLSVIWEYFDPSASLSILVGFYLHDFNILRKVKMASDAERRLLDEGDFFFAPVLKNQKKKSRFHRAFLEKNIEKNRVQSHEELFLPAALPFSPSENLILVEKNTVDKNNFSFADDSSLPKNVKSSSVRLSHLETCPPPRRKSVPAVAAKLAGLKEDVQSDSAGWHSWHVFTCIHLPKLMRYIDRCRKKFTLEVKSPWVGDLILVRETLKVLEGRDTEYLNHTIQNMSHTQTQQQTQKQTETATASESSHLMKSPKEKLLSSLVSPRQVEWSHHSSSNQIEPSPVNLMTPNAFPIVVSVHSPKSKGDNSRQFHSPCAHKVNGNNAVVQVIFFEKTNVDHLDDDHPDRAQNVQNTLTNPLYTTPRHSSLLPPLSAFPSQTRTNSQKEVEGEEDRISLHDVEGKRPISSANNRMELTRNENKRMESKRTECHYPGDPLPFVIKSPLTSLKFLPSPVASPKHVQSDQHSVADKKFHSHEQIDFISQMEIFVSSALDSSTACRSQTDKKKKKPEQERRNSTFHKKISNLEAGCLSSLESKSVFEGFITESIPSAASSFDRFIENVFKRSFLTYYGEYMTNKNGKNLRKECNKNNSKNKPPLSRGNSLSSLGDRGCCENIEDCVTFALMEARVMRTLFVNLAVRRIQRVVRKLFGFAPPGRQIFRRVLSFDPIKRKLVEVQKINSVFAVHDLLRSHFVRRQIKERETHFSRLQAKAEATSVSAEDGKEGKSSSAHELISHDSSFSSVSGGDECHSRRSGSLVEVVERSSLTDAADSEKTQDIQTNQHYQNDENTMNTLSNSVEVNSLSLKTYSLSRDAHSEDDHLDRMHYESDGTASACLLSHSAEDTSSHKDAHSVYDENGENLLHSFDPALRIGAIPSPSRQELRDDERLIETETTFTINIEPGKNDDGDERNSMDNYSKKYNRSIRNNEATHEASLSRGEVHESSLCSSEVTSSHQSTFSRHEGISVESTSSSSSSAKNSSRNQHSDALRSPYLSVSPARLGPFKSGDILISEAEVDLDANRTPRSSLLSSSSSACLSEAEIKCAESFQLADSVPTQQGEEEEFQFVEKIEEKVEESEDEISRQRERISPSLFLLEDAASHRQPLFHRQHSALSQNVSFSSLTRTSDQQSIQPFSPRSCDSHQVSSSVNSCDSRIPIQVEVSREVVRHELICLVVASRFQLLHQSFLQLFKIFFFSKQILCTMFTLSRSPSDLYSRSERILLFCVWLSCALVGSTWFYFPRQVILHESSPYNQPLSFKLSEVTRDTSAELFVLSGGSHFAFESSTQIVTPNSLTIVSVECRIAVTLKLVLASFVSGLFGRLISYLVRSIFQRDTPLISRLHPLLQQQSSRDFNALSFDNTNLQIGSSLLTRSEVSRWLSKQTRRRMGGCIIGAVVIIVNGIYLTLLCSLTTSTFNFWPLVLTTILIVLHEIFFVPFVYAFFLAFALKMSLKVDFFDRFLNFFSSLDEIESTLLEIDQKKSLESKLKSGVSGSQNASSSADPFNIHHLVDGMEWLNHENTIKIDGFLFFNHDKDNPNPAVEKKSHLNENRFVENRLKGKQQDSASVDSLFDEMNSLFACSSEDSSSSSSSVKLSDTEGPTGSNDAASTGEKKNDTDACQNTKKTCELLDNNTPLVNFQRGGITIADAPPSTVLGKPNKDAIVKKSASRRHQFTSLSPTFIPSSLSYRFWRQLSIKEVLAANDDLSAALEIIFQQRRSSNLFKTKALLLEDS
eukprot:GDKJ01010020.1.p1 GENE.GDKJ01010020.1~~GDKJ01010020.1.p1  ORF type:complete len:1898 (+),score=466.69 GDKJ01010020.1:1497-7190(+)